MNEKPDWISSIKALAWDLDGTLYPFNPELSEQIKQQQNKRVADKLATDEMVAEFQFKKVREWVGSSTQALGFFGINGTDFFTKIWDEVDLSLYIKPDPKISELFDSLKNYPHLLISNANRLDQIERKLKLIGLDHDVFDVIVDTVELGSYKPSPKPYHEAISRFNLRTDQNLTTEEVLYIGDRIETDIMGAKGVGMKTCLVGKESEEADVLVREVYEVGDMLSVTA